MSKVAWLLSPEAREACELARQMLADHENALRVVKRLRKTLLPEHSALVMELSQLQIKAKAKFSRAENMLFTKVGYEQATSERISRYKASLFPPGVDVADICCGIGGDAIGLAVGRRVIAIDSQSLMCQFSAANLELYERTNFETRAVEFSREVCTEFECLHFDPDRRVAGRTILPNDFSPSLQSIIAAIGNRLAAIKLAPASKLPHELREKTHCEWIGESREAKQQIVWFNHPQKPNGKSSATVVDRKGVFDQLVFENDIQFSTVSIAKQVGEYIFEPHSVVLAGKLNRGLARNFALERVGRGAAYLTGNSLIETKLLAAFKVVEVVPLQIEKIANAIRQRGFGKIEWKKRAIEQETFEQLRRIRTKGDISITAIVTPASHGPVVVFCQRIFRQNVESDI